MPGTSADRPNTYPFDTPYEGIYQDLCSKDKKAYTANGVLDMLDRNRRIKRNPEKFQTNFTPFDVILSCEGNSTVCHFCLRIVLERVYDQILDSFNTREQATFEQCHIINCDIVDNHEDATLGAIILSQIIDELIQHEGTVLS